MSRAHNISSILSKIQVTITDADLTEVTNGVAQAINLGSALPTGAFVFAHDMSLTAAFEGGGATTVALDVGGTDADAIIAADAVGPGAVLNRRSGAAGILTQGSFSGEQLTATFTPDGAHNLNDLTAGSVTLTIWYGV